MIIKEYSTLKDLINTCLYLDMTVNTINEKINLKKLSSIDLNHLYKIITIYVWLNYNRQIKYHERQIQRVRLNLIVNLSKKNYHIKRLLD